MSRPHRRAVPWAESPGCRWCWEAEQRGEKPHPDIGHSMLLRCFPCDCQSCQPADDAPRRVRGDLCWWCEHFQYDAGDRGYSEETPGWSMSMRCGKGFWEFKHFETSQEDLRKMLSCAVRCREFSPTHSTRDASEGGPDASRGA